jgi:excisionase family DNA binding protein
VGEGRTEPHSRRLTASQAAEQLGVSTEAIRGRIRRGTIRYERVGGRVFVLLPVERTTDQAPDQSELVEELRRQNEYLREENLRKDHLLAAALERIPAIEAPASPEATESPSEATPQPGRVEPQPSVEAADEAERAGRDPSESAMGGGRLHGSWWRRMFGG